MSIRIVTDSAADISQDTYQDLSILPMTITFGEHEFSDGVDLTHQQFYELLIEKDEMPVTSQINPAQFEEAFRNVVSQGETVIAVVLSAKLSGTYQSACIAAEEFPGRVFVVDSENAAIGEGILVQRALQLARQGMDAETIVNLLNEEKKDIRLVALLDTLEYLVKGGRLSRSAAVVGGILSIKPVICIECGEIKVLGKARGSKNGNNLLIQEIQKTSGIDFSRPYCLGYTGLSDTLIQKYILDSGFLWEDYTENLPVSTIGGTIGTHVGPGAIAAAFFTRKGAESNN